VSNIEAWWSDGERVAVPLGGTDRAIFVRRTGSGPAMTLLHGFPSSSHDWARVAPALARRHALLLPDFLGFGASEKPADHDYSIAEQADLVEALWALEGIASTVIVAHDYAVSVTQELLTRRAEGALAVDLVAVHLLNGGLYPDVYRPQPGQLALLDPEQGPQISANITEELWTTALKPTFAEHRCRSCGECSTRSPVRTWRRVSASVCPTHRSWRSVTWGTGRRWKRPSEWRAPPRRRRHRGLVLVRCTGDASNVQGARDAVGAVAVGAPRLGGALSCVRRAIRGDHALKRPGVFAE
jgi:pimeloyl-ACP methyl ester carboxylesterase